MVILQDDGNWVRPQAVAGSLCRKAGGRRDRRIGHRLGPQVVRARDAA